MDKEFLAVNNGVEPKETVKSVHFKHVNLRCKVMNTSVILKLDCVVVPMGVNQLL